MVDLKKLEALLDAALERETTESLNRWIDTNAAEDVVDGAITTQVI